MSARMRLTLGYAGFLVAAGMVTAAAAYVIIKYIPNYPLTASNPRDTSWTPARGEILDTLLTISWGILLLLAAIGLAGGWALAGWVLRPLQQINEAAQIAATGKLDHRINLVGRNDEFQQLADNFDHMLTRLSDAFDAHQRFAANASHELRTPLTVTSTLLDVARSSPEQPDYPRLLDQLQVTNDRAIRITDALLRLADADAASIRATSVPVDLAGVAHRSLTEQYTEAARHQVTVHGRLEPAPTFGDPVLLEQLVTNLVQNAIRHNTRPGTAYVSTGRDPASGAVVLRTENPGPEYSPEAAARLSEPFLRGGGRVRVAGQVVGHGLGLALVERIVAAHDGTLALEPRPGGGLVVTAVLRSPAPVSAVSTCA
ncbi:sensor histidine kinase [Pseudonocardia xinjiangensis]|nr:HAMP domain-containing sensor histidine kinase [Pseudonocardia xinjiangensis]